MSHYILSVAQFICDEYRRENGKPIGELDLQKYLYFSQREKIAVYGTPMFEDEMQGWKYGPVSPLVRGYYDNGDIYAFTEEISDIDKRIIYNVLHEYTGNLVALSHEDVSWKISRKGLHPNERGNTPLRLSDIREDAKKSRRYDHVWNKSFDDLDDTERVYNPDTVKAIRGHEFDEPISAEDFFKEIGL